MLLAQGAEPAQHPLAARQMSNREEIRRGRREQRPVAQYIWLNALPPWITPTPLP